MHNGDDINESEPIVEELKKEVSSALRAYRLHFMSFCNNFMFFHFVFRTKLLIRLLKTYHLLRKSLPNKLNDITANGFECLIFPGGQKDKKKTLKGI